MNHIPCYIIPSSDLIECLDRLYQKYKSCQPAARTVMVVYDTEDARDDGDPLYFSASYSDLSDIIDEADSYLCSNVCCEVRIDGVPIYLTDDEDSFICGDGVSLLKLPRSRYNLLAEYSIAANS